MQTLSPKLALAVVSQSPAVSQKARFGRELSASPVLPSSCKRLKQNYRRDGSQPRTEVLLPSDPSRCHARVQDRALAIWVTQGLVFKIASD